MRPQKTSACVLLAAASAAALACLVNSAAPPVVSSNTGTLGAGFAQPTCQCHDTSLLDIKLLPSLEVVQTSLKDAWPSSVNLMFAANTYCPAEKTTTEDSFEEWDNFDKLEEKKVPESELPQDDNSRMQRVLADIENDKPRCSTNTRRMGLAISMSNCHADFGPCVDSSKIDPTTACTNMHGRVVAALVGKVDKKHIPCFEDCEFFVKNGANKGCLNGQGVNMDFCKGLPASGSDQCVTDQDMLKQFRQSLTPDNNEEAVDASADGDNKDGDNKDSTDENAGSSLLAFSFAPTLLLAAVFVFNAVI